MHDLVREKMQHAIYNVIGFKAATGFQANFHSG